MEEVITLGEEKQKQTDSSIYRSLYFQEEYSNIIYGKELGGLQHICLRE